MYFPFFRGKQYELISIREQASLMSELGFVPIIEPVKESLRSLERTLDSVHQVNGRAVLIVNPQNGDHSDNPEDLQEYAASLKERPRTSIGILLTPEISSEQARDLCQQFQDHHIAFIHANFPSSGRLAEHLGEDVSRFTHIFIEGHCGKLYRRKFAEGERVLLRDGFIRRTNRDHPKVESFSDLHITYIEENVDGFGDFLIVGDDYFESGGPAYAVAIHLTFIDPTQDSEMYIYHFKSDRTSTPTDPAGKFAEALEKLVREVEKRDSHILRTTAVEEFLELHRKKHFPGLGSVKRLSMNHHIETLADFLRNQG